MTLHLAPLPGRLADVPVDPDADTARQWAERELADPAYHHGPTLLSRLLTWLQQQLDGLARLSPPSPGQAAAWIVGVVLVIVLVAVLVAGPVRRAHAQRDVGPGVVLGDDARSADQLRAAAGKAAAAGDWSAAVADRFRAVVRGLEERAVLDERPGRTADEAARAAGTRLVPLAADLAAGARLFDDVVYGHRAAGPQDEATVRALDEAVRAARPAPLAVGA